MKLIFGQIVKKLSPNFISPCTESAAHLSRFCTVIRLGSQIKTKLDNSFDIAINFWITICRSARTSSRSRSPNASYAYGYFFVLHFNSHLPKTLHMRFTSPAPLTWWPTACLYAPKSTEVDCIIDFPSWRSTYSYILQPTTIQSSSLVWSHYSDMTINKSFITLNIHC